MADRGRDRGTGKPQVLTRSKFGHSVSIIWERGHQGGLARQRAEPDTISPQRQPHRTTTDRRVRPGGLRRLQRLRPAGPAVACPGLSSFYEPKRRDDAPHPWLPSRISRLRRPRSSGDNSPRRCSSLPILEEDDPEVGSAAGAPPNSVRKSASPGNFAISARSLGARPWHYFPLRPARAARLRSPGHRR